MAPVRGIGFALGSAALFGASTPLARALVGGIDPLWLAGLLYAGSGVGLTIMLMLRVAREGRGVVALARSDLLWLAATVVCGGVVAPALFTFGLRETSGATASLLLNLESVMTVALAWFVFREHRSARVVAGMAAIVAACVVLSWPTGVNASHSAGAALIALACLGWALDNNLTRKIAANDAMLIAAVKGCVGGLVNLTLATFYAGELPWTDAAVAAGLVGFFGYGISLVWFVIALRELGAARTGAYFATAPFIGAALAFTLLGERPVAAFFIALPLMACGVWLHLTERHSHTHVHDRLVHDHPHRHDAHHRHVHAFPWDGTEPHRHEHVHEPLVHAHPHFPDLHHRHEH
ncbi:MAG TPA: EamA family transporter [Casimicrobiaceae bacterium]|jgi:drug/metabolite transporter (DMT)-like permease|nr:EamA family transporter [Casimicrobiaceae bacterium]